MTPEAFFDNFAYLADAPNGVKKLRELILQLAVRGKLVPQDSNDEPAAMLLQRIQAKKALLVKEKKLRNLKALPKIESEETVQNLPDCWVSVRLGEIGDWGAGSTPDRKTSVYYDGNIPWFKSGELNDSHIHSSEEKISDAALQKFSLRLNKPGDVLIAMYGATIGKVAILDVEGTTNQAVCACTCYDGINNEFLLLTLKACKPFFIGQGAGGAQPNISREKIIHTIVPLPPLAEQHRIVVKVDQLMTLCDELENRQLKKQKKLTRLNNAALDQLTSTCDADDFTTAWQLVRDNFDLLYTTPETIAKLRQSILQLAVQGKLIVSDNRGSWKNGVLGDAVERSEAGWSPQCENRPRTGDEWGVLKVSAVSWDRFNSNENKALPSHLNPRPEYEVKTGDFLISRANTAELVAKSVVVFDVPPRLTLSDKTVRLHFCADASPSFFCLVNNSPAAREYYAANAGGTSSSMKNVTRQQILSLPVIIPPLAEQLKIVAKADQLMKLCDTLEARLTKVQAKADKLTASTVKCLLAA